MNVTLLISLLYLTSSLASGCINGWFGADCLYQCHCEKYQCDNNGTCLEGSRCQSGYFGPACQYEDIVTFGTIETDPINALANGTTRSCNVLTTSEVNSLTIKWNTSYHFSWLRIIVKENVTANHQDYSFEFITNNRNLRGNGKKAAIVNQRTFDVHYNIITAIDGLVISGRGVNHLCSLHISGGYNVALKQKTNESSTFSNYQSANAVDGVRPKREHTSAEYCSHTQCENKQKWMVYFSTPHLVTRYVVYNRLDSPGVRLRGFDLRSFNESNIEVFNYTDNSALQSVYTIPSLPTRESVSRLEISLNNTCLTLCEVEVYVEPHCPRGKYGRECNSTCNCRDTREACFFSTGGCPSGCATGYQGEACQHKCEQGKFGVNCAQNCSSRCLNNSCDIFNGSCDQGCANEYLPPHCTQEYQDDDDNLAVTIGVIFGIIVILIVSIVLVILWRQSTRSHFTFLIRNKNKDNTLDMEIMTPSSTASIVFGGLSLHNPTTSKDKQIESSAPDDCGYESYTEIRNDGTYEIYTKNQEKSSSSIRVEDLESFILSHDVAYFQSQFESVPITDKEASMNAALSTRNKQKNRYKNICAYDHSRVTLSDTQNKGKNESDYINASFIQGYKNEMKFIASQGPTKIMVNDFIRMLWEYKINKVVMLTNLVEYGKQKCDKYWPDDGHLVFGEIEVHLATTHVFADYTIRKLILKKSGHSIHSFTHFHFTSWPDKGVPETAWPLVDFEQRVAASSSNRPVVVHCSAGVGRTGTFIALCIVIREANDTGAIDFQKTLTKLRKERVQMIQTNEQYIFLHKAAHVSMMCKGTTVSAADVGNRITSLESNFTNGLTNMEKEFNGVCSMLFENDQNSKNEKSKENMSPVYKNISYKKSKDRFSKIVPKDINRPVIRRESRSFSDYINAVLVPSFTQPKKQILTQLPLPTTIKDFWRLVMQQNVTLIVAFEANTIGIDLSVSDYLPSADNKHLCELYDFTAGPIMPGNNWEKQDITIETIAKKKSFRRFVHQKLNVTHLKFSCTSLDPEFLLSAVTQIRSCRLGNSSKTLYMCRNGAQYSGLACVLTLLLDRMDNDLHLTVPLVVGAMKLIRPEVIPTLEQYRSLYAVLKLYTENKSEYTNFGKSGRSQSLVPTSVNNVYNNDLNVYNNS